MKRIAAVYDVEGWAWHHRALGLRKYAPPGYRVDTIPQSQFNYQSLRAADYTAIFLMSWIDMLPVVGANCWTQVTNSGLQYRYCPGSEEYPVRCASKNKNRSTAKNRLRAFQGIICIDPRATGFVKSVNSGTVHIRTGIDHAHYVPKPFRKDNRVTIGWCGKSFADSHIWTPKGRHEVLNPLRKKLGNRVRWKLNFNTHQTALTRKQMVDWYADIDLLLVTSSCEGTPSTLLEAMSCGRPFLATDVGIVSEVLRDNPNCGWLLPGYINVEGAGAVVEAAGHKIRELILDRDALILAGAEARMTIEAGWTWEELAPRWLETMAY